MARRRLLDALCTLYPTHTRETLLARVLCGDVRVNGERVREPGRRVESSARIVVERLPAPGKPGGEAGGEAGTQDDRPWVGRGALKLVHALDRWSLAVEGLVVLDAGASTGGFTDALLRRGARLVHAVDVGYNQLDYRLRTSPRVAVHERTNIMAVDQLDPPADAAVADLSFRSLVGAARHILSLTRESWAVLLVKPQFEWENPPPEFDGRVPDGAADAIVDEVVRKLREEGVVVRDVAESPIRGRSGNREFLVLAAGETAATS